MDKEIEVRFLEINPQEIIAKLKSLDAKFKGDWLQLRNCYDFKPVRKNSWIRLRTNGTKTTLTIKEINSTAVDGTGECEIEVSNFDTTDEILQRLGYKARSVQENRRVQYVLDGVEIDIDCWPYIPVYLELEANSEQSIKDVCIKLGLDYNQSTTLDVMSIYDKYGIDISNIPILKLEEDRKIN